MVNSGGLVTESFEVNLLSDIRDMSNESSVEIHPPDLEFIGDSAVLEANLLPSDQG